VGQPEIDGIVRGVTLRPPPIKVYGDDNVDVPSSVAGRLSTSMLDLVLPDFAGFKVLRRLKADRATKNGAVILRQPFTVKRVPTAGTRGGAAAYTTEPFDLERS
jgi:DNA-binding response OmpR family regulator